MPFTQFFQPNFFQFFNQKKYAFSTSFKQTKLRASFQCPREERIKFKNSHAQLTISVGATTHDGERLQSAIDLINNSFQECTLMIDDSLQWPTLGLHFPLLNNDQLLALAIDNGDKWLEEKKSIYERLTIPYKIVRWKDWMRHPNFYPAINRMITLYNENTPIKQAIDINVGMFLERYGKNFQTNFLQNERAISLCTRYLIEECAIMREFWPMLQTHYEVYPSKRSPAMSAVYDLWIQPEFPDLLKSVTLRFERRNIEEQKKLTKPADVYHSDETIEPVL